MKPPVVYDKAKYHLESVQQSGLDNVQSQVHTAFFLGWLIDNSLLSSEMENDSADLLAQYRSGEKTALDVYGWWDGCLIDDMLSDEGNEFAAEYFDFSRGEYIHDYIALLAADLPSEFHVEYNSENYEIISLQINRRYNDWRATRNGG